jgi:hypothetical protein
MKTNNQLVVSKKQVLKSISLAFLIGGLIFIIAVLPAEYGKDPLGTGKLLGFGKLYTKESSNQLNYKKIELKDVGSPSNIIKPSEANNPISENQFDVIEDSISVKIPAKKGVEYKVKMLKYGSTKYEWHTQNKEIVFLDFHGEVEEKNPPKEVFYESYTVAYSNNMGGTFTAPFKGKHGWYFKNLSNKEITITIKLEGQYKLFKK